MSAPNKISENAQPVRNASVQLYQVGDDTIFYDSLRDQVFAVSALGRAVWDRCDGATSLREIGQEIGRSYEVPVRTAVERVRRVASSLLQQKLLYSEKEEIETQIETEYVAFGDHQVAIRTDASEVIRAARRLFGPMLGKGNEKTIDTLGVYALGENRYNVQRSRVVHVQQGSLQEAMRSIKHEVVLRFVETRSDLIWLHAGAVARDGAALLFVGEWGSGKSTMVAALYRAGWTYLSDDMVPYDPVSERVMAFPLTIAYREQPEERVSRDAIPNLQKSYVDLQSDRVQRSPLPIRAIVFPTFQPEEPPELNECGTAEAAVAIIQQCQNVNEYHGDAIQELCEVVSRRSSFKVSYNHPASITDLLEPIGAPMEE